MSTVIDGEVRTLWAKVRSLRRARNITISNLRIVVGGVSQTSTIYIIHSVSHNVHVDVGEKTDGMFRDVKELEDAQLSRASGQWYQPRSSQSLMSLLHPCY